MERREDRVCDNHPGSALIQARGFLLPALQFSPTISYICILVGLWWNMTGMLWLGILFFGLMRPIAL